VSVDCKHYVLLGADIGYKNDDETYDKLEPYMDRKSNKLDCIYDGMNGEYILVGKILCDGDGCDGMNLTKIEANKIPQMCEETKQKIKALLNLDVEVNLIALTHWY
jgi:hypothetical protein